MDLIKNYPWTKTLKVSTDDFKKWESNNSQESFVFWSLKNKVINKEQYFNWAVEQYQIPFLQDLFFEQHLMTKTQWKKIKDLSEWTQEMMPVAVWNDIIFIGCVDPVKQENQFNFNHRFVLTSNRALQITWKFTKELSKAIKKDAQTQNQTNPLIHQPSIQSKLDQDLKVLASSDKKDTQTQNQTNPLIHQPSIQSKLDQDLKVLASSDKKDAQTQNQLKDVKALNFFPENEEIKDIDLENNTFPGRHHEKDNNIIMGKFQKKISENVQNTSANSDEQVASTATGIRVQLDQNYEILWEQTKAFFCTSMILTVQDDKIYPLIWSGRMQVNETDEELADLKSYSLFKVIQRGHSYHGFVVETEANRKFFNKIGWKQYPKHITAIPIKNEKQELESIFSGLSVVPLSKDKISSIEKIISNFTQSNNKKLLKSA